MNIFQIIILVLTFPIRLAVSLSILLCFLIAGAIFPSFLKDFDFRAMGTFLLKGIE